MTATGSEPPWLFGSEAGGVGALPNVPGSDSFKGVTERPCLRCHHPLTLDAGQLTYCSVCGAPQIFLSEELQQQAAEVIRSYGERTTAGAAEETEPETGGLPVGRLRRARGRGANRWPMAVEYALLSSGIALALGVGALLFAPLLLLDWIWIVSAPILTVSFYNTRSQLRRPVESPAAPEPEAEFGSQLRTQAKALSAGFAARLGLLTGLLILVSSAAVFTLGAVLARFALHSHEIDTELAAAFAQVRTTTQAQYGDAAAPILHMLGVPEFRVGFLLWMVTVTSALYLLLAAVTAGFAGLLLSRRRTA